MNPQSLAAIYQNAHKAMRNIDGLQPQEAFDELLKYMFFRQCNEEDTETYQLSLDGGSQYGLKTRVYTTQESKIAYLENFGAPGNYALNSSSVPIKDGKRVKTYDRIFIRHKKT